MIDVTFGSISNRLGKPEFLALREYMEALPRESVVSPVRVEVGEVGK